MSILIKGMEMPTNCAGCFNRGCGCGLWQEVVLPAHQRHKYCPLVPIPPHGDLIERKAVGLTDFEIVMCNGDYKEGLKMLLKKIELAPIIIPAEEDEK